MPLHSARFLLVDDNAPAAMDLARAQLAGMSTEQLVALRASHCERMTEERDSGTLRELFTGFALIRKELLSR